MNSDRQKQCDDFLTRHKWDNFDSTDIAGDASFRSYKRLQREVRIAVLPDAPPPKGVKPFISSGQEQVILMDSPPLQEDVRPFIKVDEFLCNIGLSAPKIIAQDVEDGFLLLEDFGDISFTKMLKGCQSIDFEAKIYKSAIDVLVHLHKNSLTKDFLQYSEKKLMDEALLLVDWYLPLIGTENPSKKIREEYISIWKNLIPAIISDGKDEVVVLRDYHADNLMWLDRGKSPIDNVGLLDFQDAVRGHRAYDLVSLLEDARRNVLSLDSNWDYCDDLIEYYLSHFKHIDKNEFLTSYAILGAQRNCKILGIFARLSLRDGKKSYLEYLPRVWTCLHHDLENPDMVELSDWFSRNIPEVCNG